MFLLCNFLVVICSFSFGRTGLAPTWDSCGCYWDTWAPWSECSRTCGGGRRYRDRSVWHRDVPECDGFEYCASNDMGYEYGDCNTFCNNGGTYISYGYCSCVTGKIGTCCDETVNCGAPRTISDGKVLGTSYTYNSHIEYRCDAGYNMTDPSDAVQTCTEHGYWSGEAPECHYAESCSSSPCQNNASCVNGLGFYICNCTYGWEGQNCDIDILPPFFDSCPNNKVTITSNMSSFQSWSEPLFLDRHGFDVEVSQNYPVSEYNFPWGVYTVLYTAVKASNGLTAKCIFNISVKPHPCPELTVPENTLVACNDWNTDYARVCKYYCMEGYYYPVGLTDDTILTCGASGAWFPQLSFQGCVPYESADSKNNQETFNITDSDNTNEFIAMRYVNDLKKSEFNALCSEYESLCNYENVVIMS